MGRGGVFELLCRARTRMGEETLLSWLLEPAEVAEVLRRQAAVEELRGRVDLRERMGVAGETETVGVEAEALLAWAAAEDVLTERWMPWVAGCWLWCSWRLLRVRLVMVGWKFGALGWLTMGDVVACLLVVLVGGAIWCGGRLTSGSRRCSMARMRR